MKWPSKRGRFEPPSKYGSGVEVKAATKTYGSLRALDGVDLEVKRGEMFGLIGPNGAGKSTLMKALIGAIGLDEGTVRVMGLNPAAEPQRIKAFVGFVPEAETPPSFLKLDEFLDFVMQARGMEPVDEDKDGWIDFFDLASHRSNIAKDMSKGTRQKLMLTSAFIHDPPLLLLDEPFINLDPIYQRKTKDRLREYVAEGGTVLISTHILSMAQELCDRVAIINKGRVLRTDPVDVILEKASDLEEAFLGLVGYTSK